MILPFWSCWRLVEFDSAQIEIAAGADSSWQEEGEGGHKDA